MVDTLLEIKLDKLRRLRELQQKKRDLDSGDASHKPWSEVARPDQLEPDGDWFVWLILAGRGWGKSRTAAELMAKKARRYAGARIALVGRTFGDVRDTMVEGDSGLLSCFKQSELRGGKIDGAWNRSLGELYLDNGTKFFAYSSEKPWQLRGPQFHFAWGDESCFWADAHKGTVTDTTWSNLTIATRLSRKPDWPLDYATKIVVATTPRPVALLRVSDTKMTAPGLMQRDNVMVTRGRTVDNLENLDDNYKVNVIAPLLGTQLGLQELDAEILENRDNALWRREWIENDRIPVERYESLDLCRVVIGVDPSVTSSETSDLTGIIVCGADREGNGYVLADYTMRGTPQQCMEKVKEAYDEYKADRVVAEVNNGGDYIGTVLRTVDKNMAFRSVRASRGKNTRAEPVSALYEQHRVHHVGMFPQLEDEMCTWAPGDPESPDRMDACLVAGTSILTRRGDVPIEGVTPGEEVWTRQGWRRVAASRCSRRDAETLVVELSDGSTLQGTPDHRVWTERGWSRMDALVWGDTLSGWITPSKCSSTAQSTDDALMPNNERIAFITNATPSNIKMPHSSIATSGNSITDVRFPTDTMCTTSTSIRSITTRLISLPSLRRSTVNCTPSGNVSNSCGTMSSAMPRRPHVHGTALMRESNGIGNTDANHGEVASHNIARCAMNAVLNSIHGLTSPMPNSDIVPGVASIERANANISKRSCVQSAVATFNAINTANAPQPVLVHVVRSFAGLRSDVYDLAIEDVHEFVANGVIVHNCVWAMYDLKDLIGGSWLDAYGIVKCTHCERPFTKTLGGTPRTKCPYCNTSIEEVA